MGKKPEFKPKVTKIKLNPEQAVLSCDCYSDGNKYMGKTRIVRGSWRSGVVACSSGRTVEHYTVAHHSGHWWDSTDWSYKMGTATSS